MNKNGTKAIATLLIITSFCGFQFKSTEADAKIATEMHTSENIWDNIANSVYESENLVGYTLKIFQSVPIGSPVRNDFYKDTGNPIERISSNWGDSEYTIVPVHGTIDRRYKLFHVYGYNFGTSEELAIVTGHGFLYRLEKESLSEKLYPNFACYLKTNTDWLMMNLYQQDKDKNVIGLSLGDREPYYNLVPFEEYLARDDIREELLNSPLDLSKTKALALYQFYFVDGIALLFYDGQQEYIMSMRDEHYTASEDGNGIYASWVTPEDDFTYLMKKDTLYPVKEVVNQILKGKAVELKTALRVEAMEWDAYYKRTMEAALNSRDASDG